MFKKFLCIATLALAMTSPAHADDASAVTPDGTWTDSQTGLTWAVCPLGFQYVNGGCQGSGVPKPWYEAVDDVTGATLGGYSDWRMPSVEEMTTVLRCRGMPQQIPSEYRRRHPLPPYAALVVRPSSRVGYCPENYYGNGYALIFGDFTITSLGAMWTTSIEDSNPLKGAEFATRLSVNVTNPSKPSFVQYEDKAYTLMVRGGPANPEWPQTVQDGHATALAKRERVAQDQQAVADLHARTLQGNARAEQMYQAGQQRTANLRARVRPGDHALEGLVIQVRGNLVQLQTYARQQCLQDSTYGTSCQNVPSRLVWVDRASLHAPQ